MKKELICINCPRGCRMTVDFGERIAVTGNACPKGEAFAVAEVTAPKRSLATTVKTVFRDMPYLPVKTAGELDKKDIPDVMDALKKVTLKSKVSAGEVILRNAANTGMDIIATLSF